MSATLPEGALPITASMVLTEGPLVSGHGDLHASVAYEAIKCTRGTLRQFFRDYGRWTSGWLEDDDRVVASVVRSVTNAFEVILAEREFANYSPETLAATARRAARETLDGLRVKWTLPRLIREMNRFYRDPQNKIDTRSARCLLVILRELRDRGPSADFNQ